MEISSFPSIRCHKHTNPLQICYSSYGRKAVRQISKRRRRIHQRLIPLDKDMESTVSQSNTCISEKQFYDTIPITRIVREELNNIMQDFIRKEEIEYWVDKSLKQNVKIKQENSNGALLKQEQLYECDEVKLEVDNLRMLEQRVTNIEDLLKGRIKSITKKKDDLQAVDYTSNPDSNQLDVKTTKEVHNIVDTKPPSYDLVTEKEQLKRNLINYDEIYYKSREYYLNLLNYKKSQSTIKLNNKPQLNTYIKPATMILPISQLKRNQRSMFVVNKVI